MKEKTPQQIKNKYRVYEVDGYFYTQKKTLLGWSYDTKYDYAGDADNEHGWLILFYVLACIGLVFVMICGIMFLVNKHPYIMLFISSSGIVASLLTVFILSRVWKALAIKDSSLDDSEYKIDYIVKCNLNERKDKKRRKQARVERRNIPKIRRVRRYHYFYSTKKMRSEKLKKIK